MPVMLGKGWRRTEEGELRIIPKPLVTQIKKNKTVY